MKNIIKVVIADDMEPILLYLEKIMSANPEFEIVGKAKNGKELVDITLNTKPDLVITDVEMPECSGIEAVEQLSKQEIKTKYILITGNYSSLITKKANEIGILEVIKKPILDEKSFIEQIKNAILKKDGDILKETIEEVQFNFVDNKKKSFIVKIIEKIFKSK